MSSTTPSRRGRDWPAIAAIVGVFLVSSLLVGIRANVPVIDDWVYAWSVEHLVTTGRLQILEISAFYPIAQVIWGALFVRLAGFSFVTLRLSTLVLSAAGCSAIYLTLRELDCRRSTSLLGALALAFDPVYFALSFSFMTDVPFVGLSSMALYALIRAIRRDDDAALYAGCFLSLAAFLVRPLGLLIPLAMLPAMGRGDRSQWPRRGALLATLAAMGTLQWELPRALGILQWASIREDYLRWWLTVPLASYVRWNLEVALVAVFPFAPLLVAYVVGWRRAIATGFAALGLAIVCRVTLGGLVMPLIPGQTWSLQDIAGRSMLDGDVAQPLWSGRLEPAVKCVGLLAVGALIVVLGRRGWRQNGRRRAGILILALIALNVAALNLLWLYNDRYYLALAPELVIVAASALDPYPLARRAAALLLVVWAAVAITGTRDMLALNLTCANLARELEASGIPAWDIDAGYASDGWRLYAHPEHLAPAANRRFDVPFVTSNRPTHYSITNSPLPRSEVIRVVPLERATWQATHNVYVVRRP